MKKLWPALTFVLLASPLTAGADTAPGSNTNNSASNNRPEAPTLHRQDYRLPLEQVIVIGQTPYWRKEGAPRWDRSKVDVDTKPSTEPRLNLFPNYTAEERDEALKIRDRNNATPKIKLFDVKF